MVPEAGYSFGNTDLPVIFSNRWLRYNAGLQLDSIVLNRMEGTVIILSRGEHG